MRLSVVTDELSADLETALELCQDWGVGAVELRGVGEQRYPMVSDFWKVRVPTLLKDSGLRVAALSPGLFKVPFPSPPPEHTQILRWEDAMLFGQAREAEALLERHVERVLPESIEAAKRLGAEVLVCFSFDRGEGVPPGPAPDPVVEVLREAARRTREAGLRLTLEVEHICWADTGARAAEFVERIGDPDLRINWDPANAYVAGEDKPYPDGYEPVRRLVGHVHFKDAATNPATGERGFTDRGVVDWGGQIEALQKDGYEGYISVESHARPKVATTLSFVERLRSLGVRK